MADHVEELGWVGKRRSLSCLAHDLCDAGTMCIVKCIVTTTMKATVDSEHVCSSNRILIRLCFLGMLGVWTCPVNQALHY
jgi:hypothetical protein